MSRDSSLSHKVAVVVRARLLTTALDTATGLMLVWLLPKREFAVLGLLLFVYELLKHVALLGFPESILYYFEKLDPRYRRAIAFRTLYVLSATALAAALVLLSLGALAPYWLGSWDDETRGLVQSYLPYFALLALLEIPSWPLTQVLLALDRQRQAGAYQVVTSLMTLCALLVPLLLGMPLRVSIVSLVGYGAVRLLGSLAWGLLVLPRSPARLPSGMLGEQLRFAVPLGFGALTSRLNKYLDKFVVSTLLPAAALAEYTVATYDIPFVTAFPYGVGSVLISRYVALRERDDLAGLTELWHKGIRKVSLLVAPVGICFIVMAPDLIPLAFGADYLAAVAPFQIFCSILLLRVTQYGALLQAFGNTRGVLAVTVAMLLTNLVLSVPMTLWWGVAGTALATLLANLVSVAATLKLLGGHLGLSPWRVIPLRHYGRVVALSVASGGLALFARNALFGPEPSALAVLAIAALTPTAFLGLAALTGTASRDDFRSLRLLLWPQ